MNKLNKNYLVIKNICSDNNLKQYLEQICEEENVNILHEEFNQFDIWNNKQSVYAEFDAKPSFDLLLWSYDKNKLNYVNYLYNDFEARYRNAGKVVSRIVESMDNGDNLDEGEKLDKVIRDELSSGQSYVWSNNVDGIQYYTQVKPEIKENAESFKSDFLKYLQKPLSEAQKYSLRENLGVWATGDWKIETPKKQLTFKQKVYNFYNKHAEKICYLIWGIALTNLYYAILLTIKYFMVK